MMHVLRDMPGTYTSFRRCYDGGYDFEAFAGWSGTATPTWLRHACLSLFGRQPLVSTALEMNADDAHWNMSNLWERALGRTSTVTPPRDNISDSDSDKPLDLQVLSDPAVHAGKWDRQDPQSRRAARIFLLRPRANESKYKWRRAYEPRAGLFRTFSLRLQTNIIGVARGLRPKPYAMHPKYATNAYHPYIPPTRHEGYVPGPAWKRAPTGKRRLLTCSAPVELPVTPVCRSLHDVLRLEERRGKKGLGDHGLEAPLRLKTLPIDGEGIEIPEHHRPSRSGFAPHYMGFYDIQYHPDVERWPFRRHWSLTYHLSQSEREELGLCK
jgi:hypothetical protein